VTTSNNEQASEQKSKPVLEVPAPPWPYKLGFLLGGAVFAAATYIVGTVIYEVELSVENADVLKWREFESILSGIFGRHLLTFVPWVIGTTGVAIVLGYLFDKQVQYRRTAESLASTDSLTLLATRRALMAGINREISRAKRSLPNLFSVLMVDVDDFKKYNDSYGHVAGDILLQNVSSIIRGSVRASDLAGRFGGEEILVLLAGVKKTNGASVMAERWRARIEAETNVTVSIGVASYPAEGRDVQELIHAADTAMYQAKTTGKNRICVAGNPG
jgi:diguanylate cyclase (GGDEF)-like protein